MFISFVEWQVTSHVPHLKVRCFFGFTKAYSVVSKLPFFDFPTGTRLSPGSSPCSCLALFSVSFASDNSTVVSLLTESLLLLILVPSLESVDSGLIGCLTLFISSCALSLFLDGPLREGRTLP